MKLLNDLDTKKQKGIKSFAVLIDPDKIENKDQLENLVLLSKKSNVDYFFVGGSFVTKDNLPEVINTIKKLSAIPVLLFPGSNLHVDLNADAILFISLISGRNPDYLIGQHVLAAPVLKNSNIEILPTGYILAGSSMQTTVSYISNTTPIPGDKEAVAACTALAGEMLGLRLIYMDAGSGAEYPIPPKMISKVSKTIRSPLIVGGGLNTIDKVENALSAGADTIVVGNGIEKSVDFLVETAQLVSRINKSLEVH